MSILHRIDIINSSGSKVYEISDYIDLSYVKKRNAPGEITFRIRDDHIFAQNLQNNSVYFIEVYIYPLGGTGWVSSFVGVYRAKEINVDDTGYVTVYAPGILDILNDRIVAYPPESVNRSVFISQPAETILHTLVRYNGTADGGAHDGRVRSPVIANLSLAPNGARGPIVPYWECSEQVLLSTMNDLATQYKVAHDIAFDSNTGAMTWGYVTGNDYTASQVFSLERGNVSRVTYKWDLQRERTVAIIGTTGSGTLKNYSVRTGNGYDVTTNNREFSMSVNSTSSSEINAAADKELSKLKTRDDIVFDVRQTESSRYIMNWNLNDKVTGRFKGVDYTLVVSEIGVSVDESGETNITAKLEDV